MARNRENFGSLSLGTGTPTGFTVLGGGTNATFEIVTDGDSEGGKALTITKASGGGRTRLGWDLGDASSAPDLLMLFELTDVSANPVGLSIQSAGGTGAETEYNLVVASGTTLQLNEAASGTYASRAINASALGSSMATNTLYWMRLRYSSAHVLGKIWPASGAEPAAWHIDYTDASPITSGKVAVYNNKSAGVMTVHVLSLGTAGDCGCIIADASLPSAGVYVGTQTDGGLRVMSEDGATDAVVAIFGQGSSANVQGVAVHQANETVYVCQRAAGPLVRVDRYGLNRTTINSTVSTPFGVTIDEANDLLYITDRSAKACYTDHIDGGSHASLFTTTGNLGYVFFDGTYIWYTDSAVIYRRDADGANQTSYGSLTNPLVAVSDGTTMVGGWFQTNTGVRSKPVASPGDSFTSVDTVTIQALTINSDGTETWGTEPNADAVYHWSDYPPTTANRTTIASPDAPKDLAWFSFPLDPVTADAAISDGADAFSAAASVIVSADLASTDGADAFSAAASVIVSADLASTDGADAFSAAATIDQNSISVSADITDGADQLVAEGSVIASADAAIADGADQVGAGVSVIVTADLALTDGPDSFAAAYSDPNNTIRDIELLARPLVGITLTAQPLMQITMTARPFVQ